MEEDNNILYHIPVLQKEIKQLMITYAPKNVLDFTFGAGGHSKICLENSHCTLTALDRDPSTIVYSKILKEKYKDRFHYYNDISVNMRKYIHEDQDFIIGDLGLSQMQLASHRGFAYNQNSNLEMNMGVESIGQLKDIIKTLNEEQIYYILMEYGEEPHSKSISKAIYKNRMYLNTSYDLKEVILSAVFHHKESNKILSRCFQAFRIYINREIVVLEKTLDIAYELLKINGLLAIITFHSLEDRIVKMFFKQKLSDTKLITPKEEEIKINSQARSAKLRIGIKVHS